MNLIDNRFLVLQLTDKNRKIINAVAKYGEKYSFLLLAFLLILFVFQVSKFIKITSRNYT